MLVQDIPCPHCGRVHNAHDGLTADATPKTGDVSICWRCRHFGIYESTPLGLTIRIPTDAEQAELDTDPQIRLTLAAAAESYTPAQANALRRRQA